MHRVQIQCGNHVKNRAYGQFVFQSHAGGRGRTQLFEYFQPCVYKGPYTRCMQPLILLCSPHLIPQGHTQAWRSRAWHRAGTDPPSPVAPFLGPQGHTAANFQKWRFQAQTIEERPRQMLWMSAALCFMAFYIPRSVRVLCGAWNRFPSRCMPFALAPSLLFFHQAEGNRAPAWGCWLLLMLQHACRLCSSVLPLIQTIQSSLPRTTTNWLLYLQSCYMNLYSGKSSDLHRRVAKGHQEGNAECIRIDSL